MEEGGFWGRIFLMLYVVIGLLVVIILLLLVMIFLWTSRQSKLKEEFLREILPLREGLRSSDLRLGEGLSVLRENTTQALLTLENLSLLTRRAVELTESMKDIFLSSRERGQMGEFLLEAILAQTLDHKLWEKQKNLGSSQERVDFVVKVGKKFLPIDSKFPREAWKRFQETGSKEDWKEIKRRLKEEIDKISSKYIKQDLTTDFAVLFLPSESMFSTVASPKDPFGEKNDLWDYAHYRRVILAGPYSILAILSIALSFSEAYAMLENVDRLKGYIKSALSHLDRIDEGVSLLSKHLNNAVKVIPSIEREVNGVRGSLEKTLKEEK